MQTTIHRFQHGYLVFTDHGSGPLTWLLRRGFRHCFVILAAEDFAVTLDPLLHRAELRVIDGLLEPVLERLAANGATITPIAVQAGRRSWRGADCMRMAKRLLGLSPWAAATPYGLYKILQSNKYSHKVLNMRSEHPHI